MEHATHRGCRVVPSQPKTMPSGGPTDVVRLAVTGMGCPNCAMRVRNALVEVAGVLEANVELRPPVANVLYERGRVSPQDLVQAVHSAGANTRHSYSAWVLA